MSESKTAERILEALKAPMPYRWKVQAINKDTKKGTCVAYIDSRDAQDRLDKVLGMDWKDAYRIIHRKEKHWTDKNGNPKASDHYTVECELSLKIGGEWVTRSDVGIGEDTEPEKSAYSDAFKRAAVKFGLGRFLYDIERRYVETDGYSPIDGSGKKIWDLTKHFSSPASSHSAAFQEQPPHPADSYQSAQEVFNPPQPKDPANTGQLGECEVTLKGFYVNEKPGKNGPFWSVEIDTAERGRASCLFFERESIPQWGSGHKVKVFLIQKGKYLNWSPANVY